MTASVLRCSADENDLYGHGASQPALLYFPLSSDVVRTVSVVLFANKEMEAQRGTGW